MDMLRSMKIYVRVAEVGSFTSAAQHLGVTTAQASRAVSELEVHLRTRLLNRTTRRVALTEAGARYLDRCREILERVELAEAEAGNARSLPKGMLRIHAPSAFGKFYVVPALARYLEQYPAVRADVTLSQTVPDMLEEGFDISLQVTAAPLRDSAMVSVKLCTMPSILCASPAYLKKHEKPETIDDLKNHDCLQLATSFYAADKWQFDGGQSAGKTFDVPDSKLRINSAEALASALREGMGVAPLPLLTALPFLKAGELLRVLPDHELQTMTVYALYSSREYLDAKISTWIAFLRSFIAESLIQNEPAQDPA